MEFPEHTEALPELQKHPIFSGSQSVGMISGENPKWLHKLPYQRQDSIKRFGHQMLHRDLEHMGLRHEATDGKYETPERSYIVYGASKQQMVDLGSKYGQDSVVHIASGHKSAKIHYTDLAQDDQGASLKGHYRPTTGSYAYHATEQPDDFFSRIPNHGYIRLNFDWSKPPISSEPAKDIAKAELKTGLLKALK